MLSCRHNLTWELDDQRLLERREVFVEAVIGACGTIGGVEALKELCVENDEAAGGGRGGGRGREMGEKGEKVNDGETSFFERFEEFGEEMEKRGEWELGLLQHAIRRGRELLGTVQSQEK